jgi:hypothetical protein
MMTDNAVRAKAQDVCWWAEEADSLRAEGCALIPIGDKIGFKSLDGMTEEERNGAIIIIEPEPGARQRERQRAATGFRVMAGSVDFTEIPRDDRGNLCDAFFTTSSAARKFIYPYYHAHRILTPEVMEVLDAWEMSRAKDVVGIAHYPPSRPILVRDGSDPSKLPQEPPYLPQESAYVITVGASLASTALSTFAKGLFEEEQKRLK